jgi:hypothetical protein
VSARIEPADDATITARQRLARAAHLAGYPAGTLTLIAQATLPRHTSGERLDDQGLAQVTSAVELLAEAGGSAEQIAALSAACKQRHGERWREAFWRSTLAAAAARAANPEQSPASSPHRCDARPGRAAG